jgi:hypothetical protein
MNKLHKILGVALLATTLVSCLKDKEIEDQKYGMINLDANKIVEIPGAENHLRQFALDFKDNDTTFNYIPVRLAANDVAQEDIKVTLSVASSADSIESYNDEHHTSVEVFPSSLYSFPNGLTVTIPKGSREAFLAIKTNPINFDPSSVYGLNFRVESVSGSGYVISQNFRNMLALIQAKNQYDGRYTLNGKFYHPTSSPNYDAFTVEVELHTTGPNTNKLYVPEFGGYYGPGLFGGALNAFGSQEPAFTIDPATNKVTVQNAYAAAVTFYTMAPDYDSHYDPATRTIYAKYGYNYAAGPVFNPAANREWTYELVYEGPR